MQYEPLVERNSTPRSSIVALEPIDHLTSDPNDYLCSGCRNKVAKKQEVTHTPVECLSDRCHLLENEVIRLKDHDIKTRLQIKELENKIISLEEALKSIVAPTQEQATPYSFGMGHKIRKQMRKAQSVDVPEEKSEVNYNNILPAKTPGTKERLGLFGSLGASSQHRY